MVAAVQRWFRRRSLSVVDRSKARINASRRTFGTHTPARRRWPRAAIRRLRAPLVLPGATPLAMRPSSARLEENALFMDRFAPSPSR